MTTLSVLLNNRNRTALRGVESLKAGAVWYHNFTDVVIGRCQFCWRSPGTGCAVVEIWGSSGSGGRNCCCTQAGLPGNAGAYSKKIVRVCGTSFICGWAGCSIQAQGLCYSGRGNCSVACIFNSGDNGCVRAEGGFGGWTRCTTATNAYCCLAVCLFCATQIGAEGCGVVCNIGGPNAAVQAAASAGDENYSGGVSCTRFWCCGFGFQICGIEHTLSLSPGIYSTKGPTCVQFAMNQAPTNNGAGGTTGRDEIQIAVAGLKGTMPQMNHCWQGTRECSCYDNQGCYFNATGIPGTSGVGCAGVRASGVRGGHGAVRITFYS